MEGYSMLRTRVERFLRENPDVQMLTLKRPNPKQREKYANGDAECYGRMPESCDLVKQVLRAHLPDDEGMKLLRADGTEIEISELRAAIFQQIHDDVTTKFRTALREVCDQKHSLLARLRGFQKQMRECIEDGETELPPSEEPRRGRRGTMTRNNTEVEIEVRDTEADIFSN